MKNQLFKFLTFIVIFTTLFSCRTAQELIEKAKEKDPNIVLCKDSIIETKLPGETITVFAKDSAKIETSRVFILATSDSTGIKLFYQLKDTTITSKETTPTITPKKTKQQIRQENKTQRNKDDQNGKTARKKEGTKKKEIKQTGKTNRTQARKNNKNNWFNWFLAGIVVGSVGITLIRMFIKKII